MDNEIWILCPKCEGEPEASALWTCTCDQQWHTFDTGGTCPACGKQWKDTQCHLCLGWSPHLDWYRGLDEAIRQQIREALELVEVEVGRKSHSRG